MKSQVSFSLVLPCFNETPVFSDSVTRIVSVLKRSGFDWEIIFVDDNSRDTTRKLIEKYVKHDAHCKAIFHDSNKGRGISVSDGIRLSRGEIVGYIDIDCEVSPIYIPECVEHIATNQSDVVVGKRIYRTSFTSMFREIVSIGYQWIADIYIHTGKIDTESGFKFFRKKKILKVLPLCRHPHWFWDTEIIVYSRLKKLIVKEVPVLFLRRFDKVSSVNVFRDSMDYFVSLWKFNRRLKKMRI